LLALAKLALESGSADPEINTLASAFIRAFEFGKDELPLPLLFVDATARELIEHLGLHPEVMLACKRHPKESDYIAAVQRLLHAPPDEQTAYAVRILDVVLSPYLRPHKKNEKRRGLKLDT
jgi:hypothetical protein